MIMYKIAICDDHEHYIKIVKKLLIKQANFPDDVIFYEFSSGEKLLESMREDYNLIFLDIQMSGIDGNETAKLLRQQNSQAILVFCTGTQQPTTESFKVHPYRYILKDATHSNLKSELPDIIDEMVRKNDRIVLDLMFDGRITRVEIKDILYIMVEKYGSRVFLAQSSQEIETSLKTKEHIRSIYPKIAQYGFSYAHNSFLVNFKHVVNLEKNLLLLDDGTILNISKSKKKNFEKEFISYLKLNFANKRSS